VREAIAARLPAVPRFRQVIHIPRRGLGGPLWVDVSHVDLERHVRVVDVPDGDLLPAVERLRRQPLDRARPLWEIWFLTGLAGARIGCFVRVHHAIADGVSGVATLAALLAQDRGMPPALARPWPSARALFADNVRRRHAELARTASAVAHPGTTLRALRGAWPAVREATGEKAPRTSLNQPLGPGRRLDVVRANLDAVKEAGHRHHATANDVLLAAMAGGLHDLLRARGERVDDLVLRAYVPVALHREQHGQDRGNQDGLMVVPLPVGPAAPVDRLRWIARETAERRKLRRPAGSALFRTSLAQRTFLRLMRHQRWANVYVANVPGPPVALSIAGVPLLEMFPVVPLIGNVTLGVGALSYAGQFNATVVADEDACSDVAVFTAGLRRDFERLCRPPVTKSAG